MSEGNPAAPDQRLIAAAEAHFRRFGYKRTTIDEPRLSELVALYEELGFEVLVQPLAREDLDQECGECLFSEPERYKTIYTRPRLEGDA